MGVHIILCLCETTAAKLCSKQCQCQLKRIVEDVSMRNHMAPVWPAADPGGWKGRALSDKLSRASQWVSFKAAGEQTREAETEEGEWHHEGWNLLEEMSKDDMSETKKGSFQTAAVTHGSFSGVYGKWNVFLILIFSFSPPSPSSFDRGKEGQCLSMCVNAVCLFLHVCFSSLYLRSDYLGGALSRGWDTFFGQ